MILKQLHGFQRLWFSALLTLMLLAIPSCPARAQEQVVLDIPPSPLSQSRVALGRQAGVSIGLFDRIPVDVDGRLGDQAWLDS